MAKPANVKQTRPKVLATKSNEMQNKRAPSGGDGKFKRAKVMKRSELITQKEKEKMKHKYNKVMRKERNPKLQQMKPQSALELAIKKEEHMKRFLGKDSEEQSAETSKRFGNKNRDAKAPTANKRAVQEYENKKMEKQRAREEAEKIREEKANAMKTYKKTRKAKFKGLCGKSKTGQMLMGNQVDNLLKKIVQLKKN